MNISSTPGQGSFSSFEAITLTPAQQETKPSSEDADYEVVDMKAEEPEKRGSPKLDISHNFILLNLLNIGSLNPQKLSDSESDTESNEAENVKGKSIKESSIDELSLTPNHQKAIQNLIETLSTKSVTYLAFNAVSLTKLGKELKENVHPYRFLLEILLSKPLDGKISSKERLKTIYGYYLEEKNNRIKLKIRIWNDFVLGLGENFKSRPGHIAPYRNSFAEALELDPIVVELYENAHSWHELVVYAAKFTDAG